MKVQSIIKSLKSRILLRKIYRLDDRFSAGKVIPLSALRQQKEDKK